MGLSKLAPYYGTITYSPSVQGGTDLEAGTKTITATAEAAGLANADYSSALTLPIPTDSRLAIMRIATRSSITPDSFNGGCTSLRCRIYVDVQDANHLLQDITIASATNTLTVQNCLVGTKEVIFNLLKNGAAHTFYFFFWVDAGNAVISLVQLWEGVGSTVVGAGTPCLGISHTGLLSGFMACSKIGTGISALRLCQGIQDTTYLQYLYSTSSEIAMPLTMGANFGIALNTSAATDLAYLYATTLTLRSD